MPSYQAPLEDFRFVLNDLLGLADREGEPGYEDVNAELIDAVLEGAARFSETVWQPLNQSGDRQGCVYENGVVRAPEGFKEALKAYYEGGWNALSFPTAMGGQGLPGVLGMAVSEMHVAANLSLSTYPGLSMGVAGVLAGIASPEIKKTYLTKLISGQWTGTMNLTEPHCGTDLRLMRTKAEANDDGSYAITGTKIFITGGEHDMVENIAHLVLAKIPGEGEGLAAVNLFLVPKFLVNEDGSLGARNGVSCGGIEDKMGIRGSSTAVLNYDQAVGYRLVAAKPAAAKSAAGEKKKSSAQGMAGMFALMNSARLGVGYQGVAISEVAYQNAVVYARERQAGRSLTGKKYPDLAADPIIVHPDVRRMLLHIRAFTEGARALAMWLAQLNADARRGNDPELKQEAQDYMNLLTPVIKAHYTDMGTENTNSALQCFGGHGYVKEHGMEQFVRDARILQLYEGANGVQALDLVGRKLPAENGRAPQRFFKLVGEIAGELSKNEELAPFGKSLQGGLERLIRASMWLAQNAPQDRDQAGAASVDYLRLFALVALGFIWGRMALIATAKISNDSGNAEFLKMKLNTAKFYFQRMMPETLSLAAKVEAGAESIMTPEDSAF